MMRIVPDSSRQLPLASRASSRPWTRQSARDPGARVTGVAGPLATRLACSQSSVCARNARAGGSRCEVLARRGPGAESSLRILCRARRSTAVDPPSRLLTGLAILAANADGRPRALQPLRERGSIDSCLARRTARCSSSRSSPSPDSRRCTRLCSEVRIAPTIAAERAGGFIRVAADRPTQDRSRGAADGTRRDVDLADRHKPATCAMAQRPASHSPGSCSCQPSLTGLASGRRPATPEPPGAPV